MDQGYYAWSPLPQRPPLRWPDGARVALCVVVSVEHYDWEPVPGAFTPASVPGWRGRGPTPDYAIYSLREYGNHVGIFRVIKLLDKYRVPATIAIDAKSAERYPYIVRECKARGWEFAGHGQSVTQMITSKMSVEVEREHIRSALATVKAVTGAPVTGWFGPEYGESDRTPGLLAELGVKYVLDWPNDEQPYRMNVPAGELVSIPTLLELDDVYAHWHRRVAIWRWERMIKEAFETLYVDGLANGRVLTLSLHPWLIGQPHRIRSLDAALAFICRRAGVWKATGQQIADWYLRQC
jgi:peptidoglycan/xylan/chitin deacetylase (PgdA/CDA1 family)